MKTKQKKYQFRIFLKDKEDRKLLMPSTKLYGQIIESTSVIFMAPYKPPYNCLPLIAIVNNNSDKNVNPLLNVYVKDGIVTATGFIHNHYVKSPVEIIYMSAIYARTPFNKTDLDLLWNKKVLILGLGTGGSKIALELARAGNGNLILADPDRLAYPNISRHEGDMFDVGKPKAQVAAERIYKVNPAVKVKCYNENIFERPLNQVQAIFENADLVIAATDKAGVQLLINQVTQKFSIPCVFGGCYEEALGGEVFYTLPNENMPCLSCLRGGLQQPEKSGSIDYSTAKNIEDYEGQPGLHAMIDFVTCAEIIISLGILLRDSKGSKLSQIIEPSQNFLLVGGALGAGFYRFKKPFDVFFQPLKGRKKDCSVCGTNKY